MQISSDDITRAFDALAVKGTVGIIMSDSTGSITQYNQSAGEFFSLSRPTSSNGSAIVLRDYLRDAWLSMSEEEVTRSPVLKKFRVRDDYKIGDPPYWHWYALDSILTKDESGSSLLTLVVHACELVRKLSDSNEQQYRRLLASTMPSPHNDSADHALFEYYHDLDGKLLHLCERGKQLFQLNSSDDDIVAGTSVFDIIANRHHGRLSESRKNNFRDLSDELQVWHLSQAGKSKFVAVRARLRQFKDIPAVHGIAWDVGSHSLSSLERLTRAADGGRLLWWEFDRRSSLVHLSPGWRQICGLPSGSYPLDRFLVSVAEAYRAMLRTTFLFDQDLGHHSALIKFSPVGAVASAEESSYSERWIRLQYQITRIPPDDVIAVSGIAFDLTEDVYTAKNKQNTARLLSTILDTAPQLIFVKNSERQFVFANKALTEFLGKAEGHLLNKRDEDAFTIPHDASPELKSAYSHQLARFARSDAEVLAGYAISPAEETIIPPNSYLHHARVFHTVKREISFDGKDCILGIATDRSDVKIEEELSKAWMELSPACLYMKDSEGRYIHVNEEFCRTVGIASERDAIGKTCRDFFDSSTSDMIENNDQYIFDSGEELPNATVVVTFVDGRQKTFVESKKVRTARMADGTTARVIVGNNFDVTNQVTHAKKDLFQAMLRSLSHDYAYEFIASVKSGLENATPDTFTQDRSNWLRMLDELNGSIHRFHTIFAAQTDTSISGEGQELVKVRLLSLVEDCIWAVDRSAPHPSCDTASVSNIIVQMTQAAQLTLHGALYNSISNSKRFTPAERSEEPDSAVKIVAIADMTSQPPVLRVSVDDAGYGWTVKEPRERWELLGLGVARDVSGNLGLNRQGFGLAYSQMLLQAVGGAVTGMDDSERGGASLTFEVPIISFTSGEQGV